MNVDLSMLSEAERQQFSDNPGVLLSGETDVCLYMRYSSDKQNDQSIEGQLRDLISYCQQNHYRVTAVYVDRAISAHASMVKRPAFQQMLSDSAHHIWKTVLVWKLDRFARNREDSAIAKMRLKKNGCNVESAKENISKNPEGIILESLLEGMAEYYSAELRQKVKRGMRESAMKGKNMGGTMPLGYKSENGVLVIDPATSHIVEDAFRMYADGVSVADICRQFDEKGYRTSRGAKFNKSSFNTIFRNERYIGVYHYGDIRIEGAVPAIVSKSTFDAVQQRLAKAAQAPARGKAKVEYLLAGKIFCGHCGAPMVGESGRSKTGRVYNYYTCSSRRRGNGCDKKPVQKDWIEEIVAKDALEALSDENIEYLADLAEKQSLGDMRERTEIPVIQERLKDTSSKIANLTKAIETTGLSLDSIVARIAELEALRKDLEKQLKAEEKSVFILHKNVVTLWLEKFRNGSIPLEQRKKMIINLLVNSVTVWDNPDGITITTAYNLTSVPSKTYRLPKGECSDFTSYGSPLSANPNYHSGSNPNFTMVLGLVFVQTRKHSLP